MVITSNFTENVTKQPCHARSWWRSLLLLSKLDKRCRWRTGFKKNSMFLELKRLLQEQKYPLQKPRGTLQLKKLIKQVNELLFVNYYRIRSSITVSGHHPMQENWGWNTKSRIFQVCQKTGLERFVSDSSRRICKGTCFNCPRNFTAMSWRV